MIERNLDEIKEVLARVKSIRTYIPKEKESYIGVKSPITQIGKGVGTGRNEGVITAWK